MMLRVQVFQSLAQRAYAAIAGQQSDLVSLTVAMPIALAFLPLRARMQSIARNKKSMTQ